MRKIGVMGGTFDPIHNGHLVAANEVKHIYDLDEVVFVPTSSQPFKVGQEMADAEHRYLMTVIATANNPDFMVSRCDIERGGVTYTFDTLKDLKSEYKEAELFFITGADSLLTLHLWQGFPELLRLAKFVGVSRQGFELNNDEKDRFKTLGIDLVEVPAMAISSTDIRQRFLSERDPWYLVPDGIVQYVNKHGLYKQKS